MNRCRGKKDDKKPMLGDTDCVENALPKKSGMGSPNAVTPWPQPAGPPSTDTKKRALRLKKSRLLKMVF